MLSSARRLHEKIQNTLQGTSFHRRIMDRYNAKKTPTALDNYSDEPSITIQTRTSGTSNTPMKVAKPISVTQLKATHMQRSAWFDSVGKSTKQGA